MILRKIGIGLIGLMFVLTLAVTESSAQRHGGYCRHDNGRHVGWYNREYRGGRRYVSSRYYAPRYYTTAYYPRRYASTRFVRYHRAPRYYSTYYAPQYYTEYPQYTSYRRYPRNRAVVSLNFSW